MQTEHFYPERTLAYQGFHTFKAQYEGVKAAHEADITIVETCFSKCALDAKSGESNNGTEKENLCLRKCYIRYFDSALLVEKEMKHYVHGQPI